MSVSLVSILADRYDVGVLAAPVCAVIWAAELVAAERGADVARRELSAVNRKRERAGKVPAYVPYGHALFARPAALGVAA